MTKTHVACIGLVSKLKDPNSHCMVSDFYLGIDVVEGDLYYMWTDADHPVWFLYHSGDYMLPRMWVWACGKVEEVLWGS